MIKSFITSAHGGKHKYRGILPQYFNPRISRVKITMAIYRSIFNNIGTWSQCYETFIYCHSTVKPSVCVIKQNYHGNYLGMEVNSQVL